jgi:hypothetical protein
LFETSDFDFKIRADVLLLCRDSKFTAAVSDGDGSASGGCGGSGSGGSDNGSGCGGQEGLLSGFKRAALLAKDPTGFAALSVAKVLFDVGFNVVRLLEGEKKMDD